MSEQESQESQQGQAEQESYTSGCVTYVGAIRSRYGRLQDAVEEFRSQAEWLTGYLFIVSEHFAQAGAGGAIDITEQAAVSYLDAVPGVVTDVESALLEVEGLAAELRRVMAPEESGGQSTPGGRVTLDARAEAEALAEARPKVNEAEEGGYRRGYQHGWQHGLHAMRLLMRAGQTLGAAYRTCTQFNDGELSEWRFGDCTRREMPPTFAPPADDSLPLRK